MQRLEVSDAVRPIYGSLGVKRLRTHTQSVGFLCNSDRPVAETSTWLNTTFTTDSHIYHQRDSNPQPQEASGSKPTPLCGHWDRQHHVCERRQLSLVQHKTYEGHKERPESLYVSSSYPSIFWLVGSFPSATLASHSFHCCITVSCCVSGDLL